MGKKAHQRFLYVAAAYSEAAKQGYAAWVHHNGAARLSPENAKLDEHYKILRRIGRHKSNLVTRILAVSHALNSMEVGSPIHVIAEDVRLINAVENQDFIPFYIKANNVADAGKINAHLVDSLTSLQTAMARHGDHVIRGLSLEQLDELKNTKSPARMAFFAQAQNLTERICADPERYEAALKESKGRKGAKEKKKPRQRHNLKPHRIDLDATEEEYDGPG